ncbi:hypothetical protein PN462_16985 [Spirulina sp. CS-785/01]|uniref:hypothetical protein n=1 Tax=Spirulina sp. CS-785/01 TaxID=3021716 RepID=UPI00232DDB91|nr:hypothetical protein [Spirulina sp. CS-785/01]MDB9314811.1 hypothetical protein [Spirulina sp. CS-785/01]
MIETLATLGDFSRTYCGAICAVLIPLNLLITLYTLGSVIMQRPPIQTFWSASCASLTTLILFFHVSSWFWVGVVTPVTFILLGLGTTCLTVNWTVVGWRYRLQFSGSQWG